MNIAFHAKIIVPALASSLAFSVVAWAQQPPAPFPEAQVTPAPEPKPESSPEVKPEATPAPEAAPAPVASPAPEAAPEKSKKKKKKGEPEKPAEAPAVKVDYHAGTPTSLAENLVFGVALGVGAGTEKPFSTDHLGYHLYATYPVDLQLLENLQISGEGRFETHTGTSKSEDKSYVAKNYLVGAVASYRISSLPKWAFAAGVSAGLAQVTSGNLVDLGRKSEYGGAFALGFRAPYAVFEKIDLVPGAGFLVGKASWFDAQLGVQARF